MVQQCNPCDCPEMYYRDETTWRKAIITLLCSIKGAIPALVEAVFTPFTFNSALADANYKAVASIPAGTHKVIFDATNLSKDLILSWDGTTAFIIVGPHHSVLTHICDLGSSGLVLPAITLYAKLEDGSCTGILNIQAVGS